MVNPVYAAWRAECIKADIEMGFFKDDDTDLDMAFANTRADRRKYMRNYYNNHRTEHKAQSRKSYEKKRAALRRQSENGTDETTITK